MVDPLPLLYTVQRGNDQQKGMTNNKKGRSISPFSGLYSVTGRYPDSLNSCGMPIDIGICSISYY
jgi:hypothetical protein